MGDSATCELDLDFIAVSAIFLWSLSLLISNVEIMKLIIILL